MAFFHTFLIFVWCASASTAARRAGAENEMLEKINSARCISRCLSLHIAQLTASFKTIQSNDVLAWCGDHRRCSKCLQPCKDLWEKKKTLSHRVCEHYECSASAEFLASISALKQGDCPSAQRASGFAAACVESCSQDHDCTGTRKCCPNGCGHTCQAPANLHKGVPLRPRKDISFLEDQQGHVTVAWTSKYNVSVEPVLYILQKRWNVGIHPNEDEATPWHTVIMTMEERAVLKDVRSHRWYQFRVSAINSQGTRGFTTPSKHFSSSRDPPPPERPQNLRMGNFSLLADGTICTQLLWDPPREEDLSIHHYKVTWGMQASHRMGQDRRESSRITPRVNSQIELRGLQPDTTYLVHVQAIAYWGQKRMKSSRAHLSLTTSTAAARLPDRLDQGQAKKEVSNELPSSRSLPNILWLEAAAPHYHNGQLQVKVFWKKQEQGTFKDSHSYLLRWYPQACTQNFTKAQQNATVQGTHFVITGLLFACKYRVAVMPISGQGQRSEAVAFVTTPSCHALKGRGPKSPPCAKVGYPSLAKKALQRPEKLTVSYQMWNSSLQGVFSWQLSQAIPGQDPVTGFQFSWVQVSSDAGTSANSSTLLQTQVLAPNQRSLTVRNLQPETTYKVWVQVLSAGGSTAPSVLKTVHTPQLSSTLL